ncbi:MAG: GNAT family N-acetyltransferase [Acidimicrobiales bacterium]
MEEQRGIAARPKIRLEIPDELRAGPLVLRSWRIEDVAALHLAVLENIEHLRPWMPWIAAEPSPIEERIALVERWGRLRDEGTDWSVALVLDGAIAGSAGLHQRRDPGVLEIGYWVHCDFTRRGIATVASYLLTDLAFSSTSTVAVEIWHDRANVASGAVARRLGYELVGEVPGRDTDSSPGEEGIDCHWRVTRREWADRRPPEASAMLKAR